MDKAKLLGLVSKLENKTNADKQKILGWVGALSGSSVKTKPTKFKVGDVLMHPHFMHPYVLLKYKDKQWFCGLLTSEEECPEILEPCNSRFFSTSYFTKVIFTAKEPIGSFMSPYENKAQLKNILKTLKELFV